MTLNHECPRCGEICEEYGDHTEFALPFKRSDRSNDAAIQRTIDIESRGIIPKSKTVYVTQADLVCWKCDCVYPRALCKRVEQ